MRIKTTEAAHGRWREILSHLGLKKFLTGKNMPCPACGGRDRFRFDDRTKDGDYYCNQCGAGKGVNLIMKVKGCSFADAAKMVDEIIGNKPVSAPRMDRAHRTARAYFDSLPDSPLPWEPCKSTRDATLWLRRYQPLKLPEWLCRHEHMLEVWINRERPLGYWPSDKKYTGDGLMNIKLKELEMDKNTSPP